eukprot:TRINITY_DN18830_c0_g1_i1.p1 TRINITY_DN18830_c0_g1~~TRINITY_DN18830_c0_g1_i1.p1  ORF type:complete len:322 (-),score=37.96 TRINITY_DN18830_c0_g1_i1:108-941(-)
MIGHHHVAAGAYHQPMGGLMTAPAQGGYAGGYSTGMMPYVNQVNHPSTQSLPPHMANAARPGVSPMTPKPMDGTNGAERAASMRPMGMQQHSIGGRAPSAQDPAGAMPAPRPLQPSSAGREQALEQRVRELEQQLFQKDEMIKELQNALASAGRNAGTKFTSGQTTSTDVKKAKPAAGRTTKVETSNSRPAHPYHAIDQDDPIDVRLEEFYNSTNSAIPFRRINCGFYRFGEILVELTIINHKLMARTEDGWNRGKFGTIDKFLQFHEVLEREKAGI